MQKGQITTYCFQIQQVQASRSTFSSPSHIRSSTPLSRVPTNLHQRNKSMSSPPPTTGPAPFPTEVNQILSILTLITHRNKNQHHGSKWWKWLAVLRRNLRRLVSYVEIEKDAEFGRGLGRKKRLGDERLRLGLEFVNEVLIGKCHRSVSPQ